MGNVSCRSAEPHWTAYSQQEWRSPRSREIDEVGGPTRDPIPRGQSAKFKKLAAANQNNGLKAQGATLHSERRANTKVSDKLSEADELAAKKLLIAQRAQLAFGRQIEKPNSHKKPPSDTSVPDGKAARNAEPAAPPPPPVAVAAWRRRVHHARFVAIQTVRTVLRLRSAVRRDNDTRSSGSGSWHGSNALGHYVPLALRTDMGAYLDQRDRWQDLTGEAAVFQAELDEVTRLLPPGHAMTLARQLNAGVGGYNVVLDPLIASSRAMVNSAPTASLVPSAALRPSNRSPPSPNGALRPRGPSSSAEQRPPSPRGPLNMAMSRLDHDSDAHGAMLTTSLSTHFGASHQNSVLPQLVTHNSMPHPSTPSGPTSPNGSSISGAPQRLPSINHTSSSDERHTPPTGRPGNRQQILGRTTSNIEDGLGAGPPPSSPGPRPPPSPAPPMITAADRSRLRRSSVIAVKSLSSSVVLVSDRERRTSGSELFSDMLVPTSVSVPSRKIGSALQPHFSAPGRTQTLLDESSFMSSSASANDPFFPPPISPKHLAKMKQFAQLPAVPRWQALYRHLQDVHRQLAGCQTTCSEIVVRNNCEWADRHEWAAPHVHDQPCQASWAESERCKLLELDVARKLRLGQLAVQLFASQDALCLPSGELQDYWSADPWLLVALCQPDKLPPGPLLEGRSWGSRILCQLVASVTALSGPEAVSKLTVVLHINDQQLQQLLADVWEQPVYSQLRANLLVVVQQRSSAYVFDDDDRCFCEDPSTASDVPGTGYSLLQLGKRKSAMVLTDEGELRPLEESVLEVFAQRKIEWLTSHRIRDLALLNPMGLLDTPMLAYSIHLVQTHRINMTMQVAKAIGVTNCMSYDSVCLIKKPRRIESSDEVQRGSNRSPADTELVSELRHCDIASLKMQSVLKATTHEYCNQVAVGLSRYFVHVPVLTALLACPATFRPKLTLVEQQALRVGLDMADITCSHRTRCMALAARDHAGMVKGPQEVGSLVPYLIAHDNALRAADAAAAAAVMQASPQIVPLFKKQRRRTPQSIVVLVTSDPVSDLAVAAALALARPGRDSVHLLTIVQNDNQRENALITLERYRASPTAQGLTVTPLVMVRHDLFLLNVLDQQLAVYNATLLVMGSVALTTCSIEAFMSSITLACLRRFSLPLLVLTSNARTQLPEPGHGHVRCLAIVEPHSRPMVHYLCGLLDPGNPLTLGQVVPPAGSLSPALASSMRTLLNSFADIAAGLQMTNCTTSQLEGAFERAVLTAVKLGLTQVVALQLPGGALKTIAPHIFYLMRTCPCPLLIYPSSRRK